ncbi:MAG TPA: endonuclease/exonuclease/phosphatase family protein [Ktedonobacteraceae bacterium]
MLVEGIRTLQPDLVALQEVIKTDEYDQMIDLLGLDWSVAHQKSRDPEGMGISIASRWPLGEVHELDLHATPRTGDFPCATLIAEIFTPEPIGSLLFVNHFPNWQLDFEYERELQAVVAARFVEERARQSGLHVMLVGDLDADPSAASIRFRRWTCPSTAPGSKEA